MEGSPPASSPAECKLRFVCGRSRPNEHVIARGAPPQHDIMGSGTAIANGEADKRAAAGAYQSISNYAKHYVDTNTIMGIFELPPPLSLSLHPPISLSLPPPSEA